MTEKPTPKFKICVKHNKAFCNTCVIEGMENEIRRLREENNNLTATLLNVRDRLQWGEAENAISKAHEMITEALKEVVEE